MLGFKLGTNMVDRMLKPKLQCLALADLDLKDEENTNCFQACMIG